MRVLLVNDGVANEGGIETYLTFVRSELEAAWRRGAPADEQCRLEG